MDDKVVSYILREVSTIAKARYTDPQQQLYYQLGFLARMLANTFTNDSKNLDQFRSCIDKAPLRDDKHKNV